MSYWPIEGVDFLLRIWGPPSQKNRPTMLVAMAVEQRCALEKTPFFAMSPRVTNCDDMIHQL